MSDLVTAAARNIAGWHECCLAALGIPSRYEGPAWTCDHVAPPIFLGAVTLDGAYRAGEHFEIVRRLAQRRTGTFALNDTWAVLDVTPLGFGVFGNEAWFVREPAPAPAARNGIYVERVADSKTLAEFERAHHSGFEAPGLLGLGEGGVYAEGLLRDARMHVFIARTSTGEVAGGSMGFVEAGVVGVYSVSTRPQFRRQGYGEALTRAALWSAPTLPAVLQPSEMGRSMYERLGFREARKVTNWMRRG